MRHAPTAQELMAIAAMTDGELLDYFLLRVTETEEIWGLQQQNQLFVRQLETAGAVPLWPYRSVAVDAALDHWHDCVVQSVSLEYFVELTLPRLIQEELMVEIMPRGNAAGCLITPHRLLDILTSIMSAAEYRLDADG